MDSGTENMDWVAAALQRIVEFTQAGGEINVIVTGINVGAQPYWNAEATMLMHTKGILVMTPESAMVLTGKQALDYSGGVSAEDNFGIGGYERVMGPNGQAQYWAPDLAGACEVLLAYYERAYCAPGERFPRQAATDDPRDRDVRRVAALGARLRPRDGRGDLLRGLQPGPQEAVRRARGDARGVRRRQRAAGALGGHARGRDRRRVGRAAGRLARVACSASSRGRWRASARCPPTARSSGRRARCSRRARSKIARAINAASGRRPLVVLANLAGFDGSPESMRRLQLEYGAEIGRAIVNFDGPIVFTVISRFHGGAFVVFSRRLNEKLETLALEGAHASVIGGAPAAAVVFAREVDMRTRQATSGSPGWTRRSTRPTAPSARSCATSATRSGPTSAPRSSASWRASSTRSTACSGRSRSAPSTA